MAFLVEFLVFLQKRKIKKRLEQEEKEAEKGIAEAQFRLGQHYEFGTEIEQNYRLAFFWYQKAADQDLAQAQYNLGLLYEHGRGVLQDYHKAAELYQKAVKQGDPWAMTNLAFLYSHGKGLEQSDEQANELYQEAAKKGHFQAQYNLAARYASGRGFGINLVLAYYWFERAKLGASALNQERSNRMLERLAEHMSQEEQEEARQMLHDLFRPSPE